MLREEIGLLRHRAMMQASGTSARRLLPGLGVEYRPPRSYEIDEVRAFDPETLPRTLLGCVRDIIVATLAAPQDRPAKAGA